MIDDTMTLEEKLKAIDEAMEKAKEASKHLDTQIDPAELVMCEGCQ